MKKSFATKAVLAAGIALATGGQIANAATATGTFSVTATVANACAVTATDLAFGAYDQTAGTATDNTSTVTVNCTSGAAYDVGLNLGANATSTTRRMAAGTNFLEYELYTNSAHSDVWGNTIDTDAVAGIGSGADQPLTVYGRIFADQSDTAPAGNYSDTVNVTVTY